MTFMKDTNDSSGQTVKNCTEDCPNVKLGCTAYRNGYGCVFDEGYDWYGGERLWDAMKKASVPYDSSSTTKTEDELDE